MKLDPENAPIKEVSPEWVTEELLERGIPEPATVWLAPIFAKLLTEVLRSSEIRCDGAYGKKGLQLRLAFDRLPVGDHGRDFLLTPVTIAGSSLSYREYGGDNPDVHHENLIALLKESLARLDALRCR